MKGTVFIAHTCIACSSERLTKKNYLKWEVARGYAMEAGIYDEKDVRFSHFLDALFASNIGILYKKNKLDTSQIGNRIVSNSYGQNGTR